MQTENLTILSFKLSNGGVGTGIKTNEKVEVEITYPNCITYMGEYKNGRPHGYGKIVRQNDNFFNKYEGNWKNGFMHGKGFMVFRSGRTYEGDFVNGKFDGYGILHCSDGAIYEGQFKNGECEGYGKMTRPNGYHYEGEWKNSRKHGSGKGINVHEGVAITYEGTWNMGYAMQIINAYY